MACQLWRTLELEGRSRQLELERAELAAERILQKAPASRATFEMVPAERRFVVHGDRVLVDASVGWLDPLPDTTDVVVADRLDRAARAEFGDKDASAAGREFDELLAAALPAADRLVACAAAVWQSHRVGARERTTRLLQELDAGIADLRANDLARPQLARTVASALRLPCRGEAPAWAARLAPFLPSSALAGAECAATWAAAQRAVLRRRELMHEVQACWSASARVTPGGLAAAPGDTLLWWLPRDDGDRDVACVPIADWLGLVRAAGAAGVLPEWPWLVEPASAPGQTTFAGVPFVRGVRPVATSALGEQRWLLPMATLTLLLAFGLAVWQQFRAARREAAAVQAQAEFLTTVTHELKTPLASIRLLGEMLLEGRATGREAEYYRMLAGEAGRLSMLIENVLDLGRVERGERAYDLRRLDAGEVVRETIELLAPLGESGALALTFETPTAPVSARLDRAAFVQALISVIDNARKYAPGPIELRLAVDAPGMLQLRVRDHGPGVPPAEREGIFDRFVRGSSHRHGSTPGVGIGLYLARTIARRLGGDLVCDAPEDGGQGAQFTFTLPTENNA